MKNGHAITGALFCASGLVWVLTGNIAIGMLHVSVGMMFTVLSIRRKEK
jgi:hypothetical protein